MSRTCLGVASLSLLVGCTGDSAPSAGTSGTPNLSPTEVIGSGVTPKATSRSTPSSEASGPEVRITRCADVRLPDEGLAEADFGLDETTGTLQINFSDFRRGKYRNVSYSVRYLADPTCVSTPDVAEVIARVAPDTSASALTAPRPEPCAAIVFEGRRYVLTDRPDGAGPGVGRPLGTAEATGCRPMRVNVYSVNEQPKSEALTVSDGKTVWLYTATRA